MSRSAAAPAAGSGLALLRLLQLASPALPVGAYSYSQGLEAAAECAQVRDAASARAWIAGVLQHGMARMEAPVFLRLQRAWEAGDLDAARAWNERFLASRESAELRAETVQMGFSLRRLLERLVDAQALAGIDQPAFPAAFAFAAAAFAIPAGEALLAYLWSWLENQVMAAVKIVPLGQTEGQTMLFELAPLAAAAADTARDVEDARLGAIMPRLALLSMRHEAQYSRLFRS